MAWQAACPRCSSAFDADARTCPSCGADVTGQLLLLTDDPVRRPAGTTVVTAGGERRPWWKGLAAVAAVVAVLAVLGSVGDDGSGDEEAERPTTTAAPGPAPTFPPAEGTGDGGPGLVTAREGTLLPGDDPPVLVVDDGSLALVELATGRVYHPGTPVTVDLDAAILPRQGAVVVQDRHGVLRALSPDLGTELATFGPALAVAAHQPDRLWLATARRDIRGMSVVETGVDDDDESSQPASLLPEVAPVGAVEGGLLLQTPAGIYLLHPGDSPVRVAGGQLLGAGGSTIARYDCDDALVCRVHLTDLASGREVVPRVPGEVEGDPGSPRLVPGVAAFSPDGSLAAMSCACRQDDGIAVVDTATGEVLVEGPFLVNPRWSPDGEWLFATSAGLVYAWPAAGGDMRPLDVTLRGARLLAAIPAAGGT